MSISGINNTNAASGAVLDNVTNSPQLALAMLMMKLAETNKSAAMDGIHGIEKEQEAKQKVADALNKARECKANGNYTNNWGYADNIPKELKDVCKDANISIPSHSNCDGKKDGGHDTDKLNAAWDKTIAQLQTKLDNMGSNIQTQMVQIQDWMGQYNSYIQGANTQISQSNQILTSLAKGQ